MRLFPVPGTAARLYNACCMPSSHRKGKHWVGRTERAPAETLKIQALNRVGSHGSI